MKTLILMRHAKAETPTPGQSDYDRALSPRGRRSAAALGAWLHETGHLPARALVSGARRTQETFGGLGLTETALTLLPELYHATHGGYLAALARREEDSLLLIGHNPAIGALAETLLTGQTLPPDLAAVPTGATFVLGCAAPDWGSLTAHPISLVEGVVPRRLTD